MKKIIAAVILGLLVACTPVQVKQTQPDPTHVSIVMVCETEKDAIAAHNAARTKNQKQYDFIFQSGACGSFDGKYQVEFVRYVLKGKDWEGDDFHVVEVRSPKTKEIGFAIYWPLHDKDTNI